MKEYVTRDIKLETIRRSIIKCDEIPLAANREKVIVMCSEWWGLRRQSAMELLKELQENEMIFIDGNDIWMWDRWEKIKEARSKEYPGAGEFETIKKEVQRMSEEDKQLAKKIIENGK